MLTLVALLCACTGSEKYPEAFGVYVVDATKIGGDKFRALRGNEQVSKIEIDLPSTPSILIFDKAIVADSGTFKVFTGIYVRNFRENDSWTGNKFIQAQNAWGYYKQKTVQIPGQFFPVKEHADKILWKPSNELAPGLYYIEVQGALGREPKVFEPFFVNGNMLQQNLVGSDACQDYFQFFMAPENRFYPCRQNFTDGQALPNPATPTQASPSQVPPTPDSPSAPATAQSLNPQWFGKWKSTDGKKTIEISSTKMRVTDASWKSKPSEPDSKYDLNWVSSADVTEEQFHYAGKSTSLADIAKRYEAALKQFKSNPTDYSMGDEGSSRGASASIAPGNYKIVTGYLGGDCGIWDWIIDKDKMLEISECKYTFQVRLFDRVN